MDVHDSTTDTVNVVIPTTGDRPDLLRRMLDDLSECDGRAKNTMVIVVENGLPKKLDEMISTLDADIPIHYMFVAEANKSLALNAALTIIERGLIIFLDDDVRISRSHLVNYVNAARRYGAAHYFGGSTCCDYESAPPRWLVPHLPPSAKGWQPSSNHIADNEFFLGFNWAAYACDLVEAGGFDPRFGPGSSTGATGQETNMQIRLRQLGAVAAYVPDTVVRHYVPTERCTWAWTLRRAYRDGISRALRAKDRGFVLSSWWSSYVPLSLCIAGANLVLGIITISSYRLRRAIVHLQRWRGALHGARFRNHEGRQEPGCKAKYGGQ